MYLESLKVANFRCFKSADVSFEFDGRHSPSNAPRLPNVNLILGDNGTGKSALLTAITLAVLGRIIQSAGFRPYLLVHRPKDADDTPRRQEKPGLQENALVQAKLRLHPQDAEDTPAAWGHETTGSLTAQATITRLASTETISSTGQVNPGKWKPLFEDASPAFFLAAYGASRRVSSAQAFDPGAREKARAPRYQRVAGLFEEAVTLTPVSAWWNEFQQRNRLEEGIQLLNSLLPPAVRVWNEEWMVDAAITGEASVGMNVVFKARGTLLPFSALSDGYRGFVGWVVDLLYQMCLVTPPTHKLTDLRGVVIVDELDLLLHPAWQRTVIETVATTFPRLQFFFTSHSPIIVGTLDAANLIVTEIDEETGNVQMDKSREQVYGLSADQVLSSRYFGLVSSRAPGAVRRLRELAARAGSDPSAAEEYLRLLAEGQDSTADAAPEKVARNGRRRAE